MEAANAPVDRSRIHSPQIDLILSAVQPEPHRLVRRATIKIVLQRDGDLLRHPGLLTPHRLPAPYKINPHDRLSPRPVRQQLKGRTLPLCLATAREQHPTPAPRQESASWPALARHDYGAG